MFGLNDEDKNQPASQDSAAMPAVAGSVDPSQTIAPGAGNGPILPPSPFVTPSEPTGEVNPLAEPPGPALPTGQAGPAMEAVPAPAMPQVSSDPPSAEAVMPEEPFIAGEPSAPPEIKKKKKKKDDDLAVPSLPSTDEGTKENLVELKKQALQSLAPLVNKLDQTPEEKFKTTMMLIQASDNADLVPEAYEAANQITDEKVRAQALLDVVNEINYFTQADKSED